ncbi:outer membrane receptor protein involved in Fe transport [Runella defluvii]|uniref:Outer membrane receptor protein involved in Fe transport n=1 Tax=Runella defluvii TaxID=370973 RepID=A0A7W5ZIA2_9BACT|nr:TonB-dependent receptor [Runella defluvii]MBB3837605.1 outer membrane receptor protein involved in Fe transport [Runella defluvii]
MKKFISTLFILHLSMYVAFAHLGSVVGRVIDKSTKQPIVGATIVVADSKKGATTDATGFFQINNLEPNTYRIEVSFVGYSAQNQLVIVKEDESVNLEFGLSESQVQLSEVKVSASNPQHQQVISSLDIKTRPINNSQEVLRIVPGLVIGQHAGGGKAEQIFLRGFDIDHGTDIRLTVDGVPINMVSHAHGQGYADAHFIIPELIEGVDFKKGLYDTDKGNFATAGWANFRTKTTLEHSFAKAEVGQFNTYRLVSGVNVLKTKQHNVYLAGEYNYSDAYFEAPQNFNRINLLGKYHGHLTQNTNLTLTASTFWSKWNASGQIPDRSVADGSIGFYGAIDPNEGGETSRTNVNAELVTLTKRNHVWKNQFFYSNYNFELYSNFTFFLVDPVNGDQIRQKEGRNLWGYNSNYSIGHAIGDKQATFNTGLNYRHDLTNGSELSRTKDRTQLLEAIKLGDVNEANVGVYVDETIQLSPRLSATAGVRFDYFNNQYLDKLQNNTKFKANAAIVSPKLNVYYTYNPNVQLYVNLGKGFHSNDTRAVVAQNGLEILPAAYGSDLGAIWKPFPRMLLNASYWYLWLNQEFVYVGDAGVVEPSGKSVRKGVDVSMRYQLSKKLFFDLDANWAKPRAVGEAEGQNYLPLAVNFTSVGGLTLKTEQGFSGSLRYRYIGNRPANEDNSIVAKGYFVTDALVNYSKNRFSVGLSVQNMFNTQWKETQFATESRLQNETEPVEEIHFTPGTPFNAKLSISWQF